MRTNDKRLADFADCDVIAIDDENGEDLVWVGHRPGVDLRQVRLERSRIEEKAGGVTEVESGTRGVHLDLEKSNAVSL
jgi:hypothetical protein